MKDTQVQLYVKSSCSSSRKAKNFLTVSNIPFNINHIVNEGVSREFIEKILSLSENGIADIVTRNAKVEFENMEIEDFISVVVKKPNLLKTPIIVQGHKLLIGYNEDEMGTFIPRSRKRLMFLESLRAI